MKRSGRRLRKRRTGSGTGRNERSVINLPKLWFYGAVRPFKMTAELAEISSPVCGLSAVLLRFIATSLTTILALYLLGKAPFAPSEFVGLPLHNYYFAEMFFLPLFGIAAWLLMASVAHMTMRLAGRESDFDRILNTIGMGMLVPMPILWVWDWTAIAFDLYKITIMAITHTAAQVWEAAVEAIGFMKILKLKTPLAIGLSLTINVIYIALAMLFIR